MGSLIFLSFLLVFLLVPLVYCTDICAHLQSSPLQALTPNGNLLYLVVENELYSAPFTPDHIDATNKRIYLFNRTSAFKSLGRWTSQSWFESAAIPATAQLLMFNLFDHPSKPSQVYAHVVYQDGTEPRKDVILDLTTKKKVETKHGELLGLYGVVQDDAGRSSYVLRYDYAVPEKDRVVVWKPKAVVIQGNDTSIQIPTEQTPSSPYYKVSVSEDNSKVQFTSSETPLSLPRALVSKLPAFGFIFFQYIHYWDQSNKRILIFKDPGSKDQVSIEAQSLTSINMSDYLVCSAQSVPTVNNTNQATEDFGHLHTWLLVVLAIGIILLIIIVGAVFVWGKKKNRKGKSTLRSTELSSTASSSTSGSASSAKSKPNKYSKGRKVTPKKRATNSSVASLGKGSNITARGYKRDKKKSIPSSTSSSPRSGSAFSKQFSSNKRLPRVPSPINPIKSDDMHSEVNTSVTGLETGGQSFMTENQITANQPLSSEGNSQRGTSVNLSKRSNSTKVSKNKSKIQTLHPPSMIPSNNPSSAIGATSSIVSATDKRKPNGMTTPPSTSNASSKTVPGSKLSSPSQGVNAKPNGGSSTIKAGSGAREPGSKIANQPGRPGGKGQIISMRHKSKITQTAPSSTIGQGQTSQITSKVLAPPSVLFPGSKNASSSNAEVRSTIIPKSDVAKDDTKKSPKS